MRKVPKMSDDSIMSREKVFSILNTFEKGFRIFLNTFLILYFQLYFKYFYRRVLVLVFKILLKSILYNTDCVFKRCIGLQVL